MNNKSEQMVMALIAVFVSLLVGFGSVLATAQMRLGGASAVDKYADLDIAAVLTASLLPEAADSSRQNTVAEAIPGATSTSFAAIGAQTSTAPISTTSSTSPDSIVLITGTPANTVQTATPLPEVGSTDGAASPIAITVTVTATPSAAEGSGDSAVETTPIPVSVTVRVSVSNAAGSNLRSGPTLDSAVLAVLPYRTEAIALRRTEENQWIQVLIPSLGQVGWLRIDQVETSENIELLSVVVP
jgi:hypothetical protein